MVWGEVYLSFDGDHDVISAQDRSRGFTSFMKFEQEDTTLEEPSASGQKRAASSKFENRRHQQRATRKPACVHIFACVESVRVPRILRSSVPFLPLRCASFVRTMITRESTSLGCDPTTVLQRGWLHQNCPLVLCVFRA